MVEEKDSHLTYKSSAAGHPEQMKLFFFTFVGPAHVGVRLHLEFLTFLIWTFQSI